MLRKIIKIDETKCDACGLCVDACHENAIGIVDGTAKLLREDYCDGLGNCLPACPRHAISFEERQAAAFNLNVVNKAGVIHTNTDSSSVAPKNWPLQIKLVNPDAAFFDDCDLLIAADCTSFVYKSFHDEFMHKCVLIIGCPKLDDVDYSIKLSQIIANKNIKTIMLAKMEVPCCGGLEFALKAALEKSGKKIKTNSVTFSTDGNIISREDL
ncbi:MAG: 4Fe-4S binding protein [Termitinemataceae bacterium]|nr:MAG: 4Fe-4S binding protein [Termitinemataceae bacterium]